MATQLLSKNPFSLLLISTRIDDWQDLAKAARPGVALVYFDPLSDTLEGISSRIKAELDDRPVTSIGIAAHGAVEGGFQLAVDGMVSLSGLQTDAAQQEFWQGLGLLVVPDGRIDLLACGVAAGADGTKLTAQLSALAGVGVATSTDATGNPGFGDWLLEQGGVDAAATYFEPVALAAFQGSLFTTDAAGRRVMDMTYLLPSEGFIIQGDSESYELGYSVASVGDINGDGFTDLIIGAPSAGGLDYGGGYYGAAYVVYGKAGGIGTVDDTGRKILDTSSLLPSEGFIIQGNSEIAGLGYSVSSAGDINGDGFADLIIGAPFGNVPDYGIQAGAACVVYGKAGGIGTVDGTGRKVLDTSSLLPSEGFIIQGYSKSAQLGTSVSSTGDINGDGFADLIVGEPGAERFDYDGSQAGAAYVVYGKAGGIGTIDGTGRKVLDTSSLLSSDGFIIQGYSEFDYLGASVSSAGDINEDGFDDFIVGAVGGSFGGYQAGEAYVLYGKTGGIGTVDGAGRSVLDTRSLSPAEGFIIQGDSGYDMLGYSVSSAGDINGDGFVDLIVGESETFGGGYPPPASSGYRTGAAYVVYGKAGGIGTVDDTGRKVLDTSYLLPSEGFIIQGDSGYDALGESVSSAGDINGDGLGDLIVGAMGDAYDSNYTGDAYVVYGKAGGIGTVDGTGRKVLDTSRLLPSEGFIIQEGGEEHGGLGYSVSSAGDINGDGFADLIIGAPYAQDGGSWAGAAYVIYGGVHFGVPQPTPKGLSISDTQVTEGGEAIFTWSLDAPASRQASFFYTFKDGTATSPIDYESFLFGQVLIQTSQQFGVITVKTVKDIFVDPNETFSVNVIASSGVPIADGTGVATITEKPAKPTLHLFGGEAAEGESVYFTWTLDFAATTDTVVRYNTRSVTATSLDYIQALNSSFTIPKGITSGTIIIPTKADYKFNEGNETFDLVLVPEIGPSSAINIPASALTATGIIKERSYNTDKAVELFKHGDNYVDGKYASLAGFSQAAYVQKNGGVIDWQGWTPLTASALRLAPYGVASYKEFKNDPTYSFENGVYRYSPNTEDDTSRPVAIVARCQNALVISFRGTVRDDTREPDANDAENWFSVEKFYQKFNDLIVAVKGYVNNTANGIEKVYVTGHSLGGGTAEEFMYHHKDANGVSYEAVVFASPGTTFTHNRPDSRIFAFEIDGDLTPDKSTWGNNAGTYVQFGHEDDGQENPIQVGDFHSMSLYQSLTETLERDKFAFSALNDDDNKRDDKSIMIDLKTVNKQVVNNLDNENHLEEDAEYLFGAKGNDVLVGGNSENILYGCDGNDSLNGMENGDILFGGNGDDSLLGGFGSLLEGSGRDVLLGGKGNDRLEGQENNDTLYGGSDNDTYYFNTPILWVIGNDLVFDESGSLDTILMGQWLNRLDTLYDYDNYILFGVHEFDLVFSLDGDDLLVNFTLDSDSLEIGSAESEGEIRIQDMGVSDHRIESLFLEDTNERISLLAIYDALSVAPDPTKWSVFETIGSNDDNSGFGKSVNLIALV